MSPLKPQMSKLSYIIALSFLTGTYTITLTELGTFYYCSSEIQGSRGPVRMCIAITVAEGASEKVNLRVFVNDVEATYSFQGMTTSSVHF